MIIDEYKKTKLNKIPDLAWMQREFGVNYVIISKKGELDNYPIYHKIDSKGLTEEEVKKAFRELVEQHRRVGVKLRDLS